MAKKTTGQSAHLPPAPPTKAGGDKSGQRSKPGPPVSGVRPPVGIAHLPALSEWPPAKRKG